MSLPNLPIRKPLPTDEHVNTRFLRDYLAGTSKPSADDRVADHDATFGKLISWLAGKTFPRTYSLDCTIRVGTPDHAMLPALAIRHFIQFTLVYVLCVAMNAWHPQLAFKVQCWAVAASVVVAVLWEFAADDTTLFFHKIAESALPVAFVALLFVASPSSVYEVLIAIAMGIALSKLAAFPFDFADGEGTKRAVRLSAIMLLVHAMPRSRLSLDLAPVYGGALFIAANFVVLLPIPGAMQHWFAAHRCATLEDVRNYGPTAPLYEGNRREAVSGIWAYFCASLTVAICATYFVHYGTVFFSAPPHLQPDYRSLVYLLGAVEGTALVNATLFELVVHRRPASFRRFFASYYATWRVMAVWLSTNAELDYPTVFKFIRPWSNIALRTALVTAALVVNSAFTVNWLAVWSSQAYQAAYPTTHELDISAPSTVGASVDSAAPAFGTRFWVAQFAAALFLPPTIMLLMFHAAWGPSFQAFTDRFETFDEKARPPLLFFSLDATLRQKGSLSRW